MIEDAETAADMLRQTGVDFICYCCMGSSIIKGWDWERELLDKLGVAAPRGIASANSALRDALAAIGARRVALITPYPESLNRLVPDFFAAGGVEVVALASIPTTDVADVRWISPERVYRTACSLPHHGVDAGCLLATDMRTFSILDAVERDFGVPVLTSNQALLWASLRALHVDAPVPGLGRLLEQYLAAAPGNSDWQTGE